MSISGSLTRAIDVLENVNPDLSDSEFIEREEPLEAPTPGHLGSEAGDIATPGPDVADDDGEEGDGDGAEQEGDIDEELAAELDLALGDEEGGEGEEDDDDDDDEDEDESDEDEDDEDAQERKLLNEEIRDLEAAVAKKEHEVAISANPLIKVSYLPLCLCVQRVLRLFFSETVRGCVQKTLGRSGDETRAER